METQEKPKHIVTVKCIAHAFDSKNAMQYFPGYTYDLDLSDKDQRKLVWLRTPRGKWIFDFDRANSSNTVIRIFFCKECGQPFEKLSEIGNHTNSLHNRGKAIIDKTQAANADEEEERLLAEKLSAEQAEDNAQVGA